jgi:pimeloyl-ACP methyl ester carboxylesterase
MAHWLPTLCLLMLTGGDPVATRFVQVAPVAAKTPANAITRSDGQGRAVILIQGLYLHLVHHDNAARAELRSWQQPGSVLVRALARDADVFAFTYGQTAPVSRIADLPSLGDSIQRLRQAGYREVVLLGFSAGGLVARQFVEDNPKCGVDRVIQVCAPNGGSPLANLKIGIGSVQKPFLQSLTSQSRVHFLEDRADRRIPAAVDFICVVGNGLIFSDGIVSTRSQWPDDLQAQGVPAFLITTEHWQALRGEKAAQAIAQLVRERQPRWDTAQVAAMRKRLWGEKGGGH